MLKIPGADQFGGHSDIPDKVKQTDWLNTMKNNGCIGCHQLGGLATRTLPKGLGEFKTSEEAWARRVQSGQAGPLMVNLIAGDLASTPIKYFAEWTDRIAEGELPKNKPQRPQGIERNVVITTWDWADDKHYLHDEISTDKRNPTVNGYGPLFGSPEYATDIIPILDPVKNSVTKFHAPVRDPDMPFSLGPGHAAALKPLAPSPYWGNEQIWDTHINNHNSMMDEKGRLWLAAASRGVKDPDFCGKGSDLPSAKLFPLEASQRQLAMLDPKTMKYTFVDTCFTTHHLQFGFDKNNTLWTSSGGGGGVVGWLNTKKFLETGDAAQVARLDRAHRRHFRRRPARRIHRARQAARAGQGHAHRPGVLCDHAEPGRRHGVGHAARQSRRGRPPQSRHQSAGDRARRNLQCRVTRLRPARRRHRLAKAWSGCRWRAAISAASIAANAKARSTARTPPAISVRKAGRSTNIRDRASKVSAITRPSSSYYTWVDQHNTLGLGNDVPVSTGNLNDGLIAYADGKMITMKVPYPTGFYAKGLDGRIDDPKIGWKGRGLWTSSGDRVPWHQEGGLGMTPMAVHFQIRPSPLAD